MNTTRIGVINVSDRAAAGIYDDVPGKAVVATLREYLTTEFEPVYRVIPDEQPELEAAMIEMADEHGCCLVVTTGGTGPAARDVTPEAPEAVCEKMLNLPGRPKAIRECLDAVFPAIPYCIDLIEGPRLETDENVIKAFRPRGA